MKRWNERRENNDAEIAAAQKFVADFFSNKYDVVLTGGRQGAGHLNYAIKSKNIDDIRKWKTLLEEDMAAARKAYLEQAAETLRMAADYIEIDTAYLKAAMAGDNMQYVSSCAQAIQSKISELQTKGAAFSNLIPDVNSLFKKFTYDQIEQTYNAISRKLASLNDLSKFDKAIALGYEAEYVANPTKYDESATKYPTWEVAQKAYEKLAADYEYSYHKDKWDDKLAPIKQWAATHKTVDAIEAAISEAERAISSRVDYKIVNKMVYNAMCLYDNCVKASLAQSSQRARRVFVPDDYTAARKDAAIWCKSESESMAEFEKQSNVNWAGLSKGARDAWAEYTKGSDGFNRPLRGFDGSWKSYAFKGAGSVDLNNEGRAQQIRDLYDAVENASMAKDTWLQRGTSEDTVCSLFGVNDIDELKGKIGEVATDFAFVSCGSAKGTGSCSRVTINIYCPKGTKALYLNPHSAYQGFNENETILQVGTKLRLVKVETKGDLTYLDVDVVGYDKHPLL